MIPEKYKKELKKIIDEFQEKNSQFFKQRRELVELQQKFEKNLNEIKELKIEENNLIEEISKELNLSKKDVKLMIIKHFLKK